MTQKTEQTDIKPVVVTMIGTGTGMESGTSSMVKTPAGKPDILKQVVSAGTAIFIRAGHRFLDALVGAEALSTIDDAADWNLITGGAFKAALFIAIATAGWGIVRDLLTIFSGLERSHPLTVGNV